MKLNPEFEKLREKAYPPPKNDQENYVAGEAPWFIDGKLSEDGMWLMEPELPLIRSPLDEDPGLRYIYSETLFMPGIRVRVKRKDFTEYIPVGVNGLVFAADDDNVPWVIFTDERYRIDIPLGGKESCGSPADRERFSELELLMEAIEVRTLSDDEDDDDYDDDDWQDSLPEESDLAYLGEQQDASIREVIEMEDRFCSLLRSEDWRVGIMINLIEMGICLPDAYFYAFNKNN